MPTSLLSFFHGRNPKENTSTKPTCFLGCFRFPEKEFSQKKSPKIARSDSKKKSTLWFSWSRFSLKKSGTKTGPVDTTVSHNKTELNCKSRISKSKLKWKVNRKSPCEVQAIAKVTTDQIPRATHQETSHGPAQNINLDNGKNLDHLGSLKDDTCQKRFSFCRKVDTIRTGFSQPGSPEIKPNPKPNRTVSFPVRNCQKRAANPLAHSPVILKKSRQEDKAIVEKFDPMVSMSIIIVTLILLLLLGRLCAIVCTCAWFYFIPRFRNMAKLDGVKDNSSSGDPDLNSEEHKKKVVLKGLLERNHRVAL